MFERLSSVCQERCDSRWAFIGTQKQPQIEKGSEVEVEIVINLSIQAPERFVFQCYWGELGVIKQRSHFTSFIIQGKGHRKRGHFNH